ncbi:DUF4381 family protein [Methylobrevis albus]|uniref:DUF4381 family protein n=1 Tax=Methylobrevis albus TaxID=2793297 RepID=A0A931I4W1_9HYPH|nr:DUF4381 family protein [Methylobrevis albus]MBH0239255.1 DUF4381 family protein [Methylobrevis albus]
MPASADPLDALRAVRLPPEPASGLFGIVLLAVAAGVVVVLLLPLLGRLAARLRARARSPLAVLKRTLRATTTLPAGERTLAQAAALRAYVAAVAGPGAAATSGEAWLGELDRVFATDFFTRGPGRSFGEALYAGGGAPPVPSAELEQLAAAPRRTAAAR